MDRKQALADVMERLFSTDAVSAEKTVRSLHAWVQQTMEEVKAEMKLVLRTSGARTKGATLRA